MQENKLYVGNLKYSVTKEELQKKFEEFGTVTEVNIIEGKGFGFVEMSSPEEAAKAKESLNGQEFSGRVLKIDNAKPPKPRKNFKNSFNKNRY